MMGFSVVLMAGLPLMVAALPKWTFTPTMCVVEKNMDYWGNDIPCRGNACSGNAWKDVPSSKDCASMCYAKQGCKYFTWLPAEKVCFLKNKYRDRGYSRTNRVSGSPCGECRAMASDKKGWATMGRAVEAAAQTALPGSTWIVASFMGFVVAALGGYKLGSKAGLNAETDATTAPLVGGTTA